jgi:hypothetical protein
MRVRNRVLAGVVACGLPLGCGGGGGGGGGGAGVTVSGKTVNFVGNPVGFVRVVIGGHAPTMSDANGDFTVEDVSLPYDVAVVHPAYPAVVVYQGLTRTNPLLGLASGLPTPPPFAADVTGFVSGGAGYPEPADHKTLTHLIVSPNDTNAGTTGDANTTTGAYALHATWSFGDGDTTAYLTAVQFSYDADDFPVTFTGACTGVLPLSNGASPVFALPLGPVVTSSISGTITVPAGYSISGSTAAVEAPNLGLMGFDVTDNSGSAAFSWNVPVIAGRPIGFIAIASGPEDSSGVVIRRNIPPGSAGLSIVCPESTYLLFPLDGLTGVDHDTEFFATDFAEGVNLFQFVPSIAQEGPTYLVFTDATSARIPDLSYLGISLPPSVEYQVTAGGFGPCADVDDFTGPPSPFRPDLILAGTSKTVAVTTAP